MRVFIIVYPFLVPMIVVVSASYLAPILTITNEIAFPDAMEDILVSAVSVDTDPATLAIFFSIFPVCDEDVSGRLNFDVVAIASTSRRDAGH